MVTDNIPQNLEAEEAILGAMLASSNAIEAASDELVQSDFYSPSHRAVYQAIIECADKGAVDELTVVNHLKHTGRLKEVGGPAQVLVLSERVPSVSNAKAYAEEVRAQSVLRRLYNTTTAITQSLEKRTRKPEELVDYAVQEIDAVAASMRRRGANVVRSSTDLSDWVIKHLDEPSTTTQRFPYPIRTLQEQSGGFARGELITVGGYSGDGKSVFALQMLEHCAKVGARIGYWSLEMPAEQVELRLVSMLTGIPVLKLKQPWELDLQQKETARDAANQLRELDFSIYAGGTSSAKIVSEQKRQKYDVVVVDHVHRMPGSEDPKSLPSLVTPLKDVALDTDCATIMLCQLNRDADRGYPLPNPNRLKGGNVLMDESDAVMFVYRDRDSYQVPLTTGCVLVSKMRDGLTGYSVPVKLDTDHIRFVERG